MFLRADLPGELADLRATVERALVAEELVSLDADSSLAKALARERLGVDSARWDLWGRDLADVFAVLAARGAGAAAGSPGRTEPMPGAALPATGKVALTKPGTVGKPDPVTRPDRPAQPEPLSELDPVAKPARRRRSRVLLVAAGVIAVVLLAGAVVTTLTANGDDSPGAQPSASASAPAGVVDYRDPAGRFTFQYPEAWEPVEATDPDVTLLVGPDGGSMLVRIVQLEKPVDPTNIVDVKAVTDVIVQEAPGYQLVVEQPVEINGASGYSYVYRFLDGKQEGVHSHLFLFKGSTLYTIVFQALPTETFESLADDFDRIAQSFRIPE